MVTSEEASLVAQLPAMQETQVPSLGQKDPLEKEMAAHYCILAWRIIVIDKTQSVFLSKCSLPWWLRQ